MSHDDNEKSFWTAYSRIMMPMGSALLENSGSEQTAAVALPTKFQKYHSPQYARSQLRIIA